MHSKITSKQTPLLLLTGMLCLATILPLSAQAVAISQRGGLENKAEELPLNPNKPTATQQKAQAATAADRPFGYNLFTGGFSGDREIGLNPDYKITEGDQITVRIWGATEITEISKVDAQGNIFIPKVGPIPVAGVRNSQLNTRVKKAVHSVFTKNVQVYTTLHGTQPVAVFVTGYVKNPGRYAGVASNSLLYYIDRAAGIDAEAGSYRDIRIMRDGKLLAQADLYEFMIDGILPAPQFKDGDTIVVGPKGQTIAVTGDVRNAYKFEISNQHFTGKSMVKYVHPLPEVSHVRVTGIRNKDPFAVYVSIEEFNKMKLADGDQLSFEADIRKDTIVVEVEGSFLGPSQFAVPLDATLGEVLHHIPVDSKLADINSISLRRKSVANRQKQTLEDSLRRLESVYLTASSATDEEARIRTQEASLITDFVKRARQIEPNGRLVVAANKDSNKLTLEEGDIITIPQKSNTVLVSGEVLVPQAVIFESGKTVEDFIKQTGGLSDHADPDRILIVRLNGEVLAADDVEILAGDEILVLPEVPVKNLQVAKEIIDVIYKIAISAAVTVGL